MYRPSAGSDGHERGRVEPTRLLGDVPEEDEEADRASDVAVTEAAGGVGTEPSGVRNEHRVRRPADRREGTREESGRACRIGRGRAGDGLVDRPGRFVVRDGFASHGTY